MVLLIDELRDREPRYDDTDELDRLGAGGPGVDVVVVLSVVVVVLAPSGPVVAVVPLGGVVVLVPLDAVVVVVVSGGTDVEGADVEGGEVAGVDVDGDVAGGEVGGEVAGGDVGGGVCAYVGGAGSGGGSVVVELPETVGRGRGGGAVMGGFWATAGTTPPEADVAANAKVSHHLPPLPARSGWLGRAFARQATLDTSPPARPAMGRHGSASATLSGRV